MPKILIFEDDKLLRDMYVAKYKHEGFEVAEYNNPSLDPVKIVLTEKPDIISMDVIMPVMDGFGATRRIKADQRTRLIPLFFLTTLGQTDDMIKGKSLGAVEYFAKADSTPSDILSRVKEILGLQAQPVATMPQRVKKRRNWLRRLFSM